MGRAARKAAALAIGVLVASIAVALWPVRTAPATLPPLGPLPDAARSARLIASSDSLIAGHAASRTVTRLGLPGGDRVWQAAVGCEPATLASSGARVYAACFDTGEIVELDAASGSLVRRARVGGGPFGLLYAGGRLYATLAHEDALVVVRPDTLEIAARVPTGRQPRGIALRAGVVYVVHYFDASLRAYAAADLGPLGSAANGPGAVFAESVTPSLTKDRLYVTHQRQSTASFARRFDNTVAPLVTPFALPALAAVRSEAIALDAIDTPVGLPIASVMDAGERRLYVANAISSDVTVIDIPTGMRAAHILVGDHPRDIAMSADGSAVYTLNAVSDDITVVDTATGQVRRSIPLASDPRSEILQRGERLFSVSRPETLSRDRWMTCGSCHLDGGTDGLTWLGEPLGPRNMPSLRGIAGTQPFHWSGEFKRVQDANPFIQAQLGGTGISEADLDALAAFIDSLAPVASPLRAPDGRLTSEAVRGAKVFGGAGCAECHSGPAMTDRQLRDVGTGDPVIADPRGSGKIAERGGAAFKTPPLRELWLTAPYLHDGRASTLRAMLTTHNPEDRHGVTRALSERDLADLEAFLLSLPLTEADRDQIGR